MAIEPSPEFLALQEAVAGRYSLERELGRGGMGVVFLARDVALERSVAIKLLQPALARSSGFRARFLREARTAAGLSHPHVVPIHAVEEAGSLVYFVMGFVDGETLGQRVRRGGPLRGDDLLRLVQEAAWALGHAHARGVIHRDVKPDNIMLERGTGRALVTDFGIARVAAAEGDSDGAIGTPMYMAPEQALGDRVDARSDLYSLALATWYAAAGRLPFESGTAALAPAGYRAPLPSLASAAPHLPLAFISVIDRCLLPDPLDRPVSAEVVVETIRDARSTIPEVPAPVRAFLSEARAAGGEIAIPLGMGLGSLGIYSLLYSNELFAGVAFFPIAAAGIGLAGARLGQLITRARQLIRQGYGFTAVRPHLVREANASLEPKTAALTRRRWRDTARAAAFGTGATGGFYWLAGIDAPLAVNFLGGVGTAMAGTLTVRSIWGALRQGKASGWLNALSGRVGRVLFRAGGAGLPPSPAHALLDAPTELALGDAVRRLYDGLSLELRERFREVPGLVQRLEDDARGLRAGGPEAAPRLMEAVAALEMLRLDLLRLTAGALSPDELTSHLSGVRRFGERVDAQIEAGNEVGRLLDRVDAPPRVTT